MNTTLYLYISRIVRSRRTRHDRLYGALIPVSLPSLGHRWSGETVRSVCVAICCFGMKICRLGLRFNNNKRQPVLVFRTIYFQFYFIFVYITYSRYILLRKQNNFKTI